jgi:hypothetical protein
MEDVSVSDMLEPLLPRCAHDVVEVVIREEGMLAVRARSWACAYLAEFNV